MVLQVKPHLLHKPNLNHINVSPDTTATFELFDRVVIIRDQYLVPLGSRGTIISILPTSDPNPVRQENINVIEYIYEILFDEPFEAATSIPDVAERRVFKARPSVLMNITHGLGRPRNEQRKPFDNDVKRRVDPIPNAWAVPLQQTDAYRSIGAKGRPQPQGQVDASTINKKSNTSNRNDTKPFEKNKKSETPRKLEHANNNTTKPVDTTSLDDALKTMLRIGPTPLNVSNATNTAPAPSTSNPSSAEADNRQSIDLNAMFQKAANGVPGFVQSPNVQALPKPPAEWHQQAVAAKRREEEEQKELTPPPQLQPQPPFFMPSNQPQMAMFPPNFVPMIPLPALNYAFPTNMYPTIIPGMMPMIPGNFPVSLMQPQNLQQFAQYAGPSQGHAQAQGHAPPQGHAQPLGHAAQPAPQSVSNTEEPRNPIQMASVNAFIPLQAARKIAKDKANTKAAQNTSDKPKVPVGVSYLYI